MKNTGQPPERPYKAHEGLKMRYLICSLLFIAGCVETRPAINSAGIDAYTQLEHSYEAALDRAASEEQLNIGLGRQLEECRNRLQAYEYKTDRQWFLVHDEQGKYVLLRINNGVFAPNSIKEIKRGEDK